MKTQEILEKLEIYQPRGWKEICVFISKQAAQLAAAKARALPELPPKYRIRSLMESDHGESAGQFYATLCTREWFDGEVKGHGITPAEAIKNAISQIGAE